MSASSTPWRTMFIEPIRSIVPSKSNPWNMPRWKCSRSLSSRNSSRWLSRRYSPAATRKPQVPAAGSQIVSRGVGAIVRRHRGPARRKRNRFASRSVQLEHRRRRLVLQPHPAQARVFRATLTVPDAAGPLDAVSAVRKNPPLHPPAEHDGLVLLACLRVIEPADEQEVRDLLDHLQRIGYAARPEGTQGVTCPLWMFLPQNISSGAF